jgi:ATP-binding cassette subfamily B protein
MNIAFIKTNQKKNINTFFSFVRIIKLIWSEKKGTSTLLCMLNVFQGLIPISTLWISKLIIDSIIEGIGGNKLALSRIIIFLSIQLFIYILSNITGSYITVIQALLGDLISNTINEKVIEKSISLDLDHYENPVYYDMLSRAQREASNKPLTIINQIFDLVKNTITVCSLIAVLFHLHWIVVIILIITSIPQSIAQQKYARKGYSIIYHQTQDTRKMFYINQLLTSFASFKEIKLFDLGQYLLDKYRNLFKNIFKQNKQLIIKKNITLFLLSLISIINYIGVYSYIIMLTLNKIISLGDLTLYSNSFSQIQVRFGGIVSIYSSLYENNLFINNLFDFLSLKSNISLPISIEFPSTEIKEGIVFKGVSFRYPKTEKYVLKDLNMKLYPNESISIVGDNGAGKTTIVKLLSRLYDPESGEILLDGINIKLFDPQKYRELFGVIFQDYSQYYLPAYENIGLGCLKEIENISKIREAASKSGVDRVIEKLPNGYNTILGKYFDEGEQLSIGEWQKIAIARAFIRNSKILILDEPTASVDIKTEYEIFCRLKELTKNRMTILISHRFSTVRMTDRIFVLENGSIIEEGTHDNLIKMGGVYNKLFIMQAEKFKEL